MLEKILSIRAAILHAADKLDKLYVKTVNPEVYAGPLSCLEYLIFELTADLGNDFLDACRMNAAVSHQLMQGQTGNLTAYRLKCIHTLTSWV